MNSKQYLIEFEHSSRHLGHDGFGILLVNATSFEEACEKIKRFSVKKCNPHSKQANSPEGYVWNEYFENARNFVNLTIE
jgi:hypothetical protein